MFPAAPLPDRSNKQIKHVQPKKETVYYFTFILYFFDVLLNQVTSSERTIHSFTIHSFTHDFFKLVAPYHCGFGVSNDGSVHFCTNGDITCEGRHTLFLLVLLFAHHFPKNQVKKSDIVFTSFDKQGDGVSQREFRKKYPT